MKTILFFVLIAMNQGIAAEQISDDHIQISWLAPEVFGDIESENFLGLLFFAFLGGIILNLMPCVLPVLSIKFLSILKTKENVRRREAVLYTVGVLTTFFALGSAFLLLRSAGSAIGWGFQLQSPPVILGLVVLFWLMSLNFLGFFEFGDSITNIAGHSGGASSFSTGVLAVFVAAPCTGPFMGTALGAAAVLPAIQALGIFLSLGLGLSFPFVLVSFVPAFYRLMPRPGAWMERLKQFLAFPLLGTVIWLIWVLGVQLGTDAWVLTSSVLLALSFAIWVGKAVSRIMFWGAVTFGVGSIVWAGVSISKLQLKPPRPAAAISVQSWVPYDRTVLDKARDSGQMVFLDFTAAWCITCQVNKKTVLETEKVLDLFKSNNVLLMRADWTNQDPVITKALAEFDRNSVPVYLFYGKAEKKPKILPQILTSAVIVELFK